MAVASRAVRNASIKHSRYHSRLGIVIAKELSDFIWGKPGLGVLIGIALFVVPIALAFTRMVGGGNAHYEPSLYPTMEDSDMRNVLSDGLWMASFFISMMGGLLTGQNETKGTWESMLITSARRWDIVGGKLLAFGLVWSCLSIIQATTLAVLSHISAVVVLCPFLSYFHPDMAFFAKLALVLTFGGCSTYALFSYFNARPVRYTYRFAIVTFAIIELICRHWPITWPLLGFVPLMNTNNGLSAIFGALPYDRRVESPMPHFGAPWDHPGFWIVCVAGGIITTLILAALTVRNLRAGMPLPNTAK